MFEQNLNKKCDIIVNLSGASYGAIPSGYTGVIKEVLEDSIKVEIESASATTLRRTRDKNYTIYIKKDYIISIMPVND